MMDQSQTTPLPLWGDLAFEALVRRFEAPVYRMAYRMTADADLAREIGQEVFETVWIERHRYQEQGQLKCYVFQIARHKTLAALKRRRRRESLWFLFGERTESTVTQCESSGDAKRALMELAVDQRELIILRHVVGLSTQELAQVLGVAEGTIKSRLSRALDAARKGLSHG